MTNKNNTEIAPIQIIIIIKAVYSKCKKTKHKAKFNKTKIIAKRRLCWLLENKIKESNVTKSAK